MKVCSDGLARLTLRRFVNLKDLDLNVFTLNKRSIMLIHANLGSGRESVPIAFVAIGGAFPSTSVVILSIHIET